MFTRDCLHKYSRQLWDGLLSLELDVLWFKMFNVSQPQGVLEAGSGVLKEGVIVVVMMNQSGGM